MTIIYNIKLRYKWNQFSSVKLFFSKYDSNICNLPTI